MLAHRVLCVCLATLLQTSVFDGGLFVSALNGMDVIVNEFGNCPHLQDSQMPIEDIVLLMDPKTKMLTVSGVFNVKRPLDNNITLHIVLKKCANGAEEHTCTKFFSADVNKPCGLSSGSEPYGIFIQHTQGLPTSCPIPVGRYAMDNAPLEMNSIRDMQAVYGSWRMEYTGVHRDGTVLFCNYVALDLKKPRKKKKKLLNDD